MAEEKPKELCEGGLSGQSWALLQTCSHIEQLPLREPSVLMSACCC
jgi:hypothetical protein